MYIPESAQALTNKCESTQALLSFSKSKCIHTVKTITVSKTVIFLKIMPKV